MDFKGTKGKWELVEGNKIVSYPIKIYVCEIYRMEFDGGKANARLISQAPDLLKSLQKLVEMVKSPCVLSEEGFLKELDETIKGAEEVIKKALGNV